MANSDESVDKLDGVVEDLRAVAEAALDRQDSSGEPMGVDELTEACDRELREPVESYLGFLDESDCLEFDRESRQLLVGEGIEEPIDSGAEWRQRVRGHFGAEKHDESEADTQTTSEPEGQTPSNATSDEETAMTEDETSTTGERQYTYTDEIGAGAFGTVYKGRDENLERVVAIKKIRNVFDVFARLDREDVVERFQDLVRAQAQISHPAIVQVYDVETSGEFPFAVTEYAPNGNLRSRIDTEERKLSHSLEHFVQILHGVHAAHERDLVHGNIKPENVVFDAAGNAKLSDFGMTTIVELDEDQSEQISVAVGAPEYKAPEQLKTGDAGTSSSDIYALGILFYEMLTGEIPSRRSPMPSEKHPDIPEAIDDIFDRMSLDDPEDRYPSVEEVLADLYRSEKIVRLIDRRSGVVHLADPMEHGRRPDIGKDAHLRAATEGAPKSPIERRDDEGDSSSQVPEISGGDVDATQSSNSDSDSSDASESGELPAETASSDESDDFEEMHSPADGGGFGEDEEREDPESFEDKSSWSLF
jgi:serine/threonine protein kinase